MTTVVSESFEWRTGAAGLGLHARALEGLAPHVFTTRERSFRGAGEEDDYRRLAEALGVTRGDVVTVAQVHGRAVLTIAPGASMPARSEADAIVCFDPARAIAVRVADCVPVLIADRANRVVAAIHAGWRGTCSGVVTAAVETIVDAGVPASTLVAALGPSIGPCCYQVDDRVRLAFLAMTPDAAAWFAEDGPGKWRLDLGQANRDQLEDAGVPADQIVSARFCTSDNLDRCYSYRKEGSGTGRLVGAIRLRD